MDERFTRRRFMGAAGGAALIAPLGAARAMLPPARAKLSISPEPLHRLPATQYGHFIEHLGKCIKGGIWAEGESDDMFMGGVRHELVKAIRSINPPLIRYPGGCFADGYHWKDGIGPRQDRPKRWNRAWGKLGLQLGPMEDNHFGTDEFCELCQAVGAEPMLTANVGSGTAKEAAEWVEYANGSKDTKWGAVRAKNGHPDPFRVKYWFVGNEIFGAHEIGHQTPEQYVKTFREYATAMRKVDPDVKLIPVGGHLPGRDDINRVVLEGVGDIADYLSIHRYVPNPNLENTLRFQLADMKRLDNARIYYDVMVSLKTMEDFVESSARDVRTYSPPGKKVPLAFDEWNLWFNFYQDIHMANYNLRDGVWTAAMLNMFHSKAPDMPIANIAQMVNCLGIISSDKRGTFLTPSALAFKMYTENAGEELLASKVECPAIPHETGLPSLSVSATRRGERIDVFVVNLHKDDYFDLDVALEGMEVTAEMKTSRIHHQNPVRYNTFKEPEAVQLEEDYGDPGGARSGSGWNTEWHVPPHSINCFSILVKEV